MKDDEKPMPDKPTDGAANGGRIRRKLEARVISCDFKQRKPVRRHPLAQPAGISTTRAGGALSLLAAKGPATKKPHKGFTAKTLSKHLLIGLYDWNRFLLNKALRECNPESALPASTADTLAGIGSRLGQGRHRSRAAVARYTGRLFSCIAELACSSHIVESVARINDNLYYVRVLECLAMTDKDVPLELAGICERFLNEEFAEGEQAIANYHDDRLASLDRVLDLL